MKGRKELDSSLNSHGTKMKKETLKNGKHRR